MSSTESSLSPSPLTSLASTMPPFRTSELWLVQTEQNILRGLTSAGWPDDKAAVPKLARPYRYVRYGLATHDGLLYKQDSAIILSSLRKSLLYKLHAGHRGSQFTLRHARSTGKQLPNVISLLQKGRLLMGPKV